MNDDLQKGITEAMANPQNRGELADADAVGTVGNAGCGDLLRVWVKFKEERGKKVIERASFQAFGCETAIATASLVMELMAAFEWCFWITGNRRLRLAATFACSRLAAWPGE